MGEILFGQIENAVKVINHFDVADIACLVVKVKESADKLVTVLKLNHIHLATLRRTEPEHQRTQVDQNPEDTGNITTVHSYSLPCASGRIARIRANVIDMDARATIYRSSFSQAI